MKFEDFYVGQRIEAGPYEVSEQEVVAFATKFDPQWFHTDATAAAHGRFGSLIASGWHTCSIAMRLVADAALAGSESFASPGVQYVKWPAPVRPGDALRVRVEVLEKSVSQRSSVRGVLRWRWRMFNQADTEVLELEATSFFALAQRTPAK